MQMSDKTVGAIGAALLADFTKMVSKRLVAFQFNK